MIPVGIHENVRHHKATKNDKGTLVLGFVKEVSTDLESFNSSSADSAGGTQENDFLIFGPSNLDREGKTDTTGNISNKIKELKDQLSHILLNYMPQDKIKWDPFKGLGITQDNIDAKLKNQSVLDQIYKNIVDQYIDMVTPFNSNVSLKFRVVFIRSSQTKHFSKLRSKFLTENPFMEPMNVSKGASKIRFTKWELDNKLNNPTKISTETAETVDKTAQSEADLAFATTPGEIAQ